MALCGNVPGTRRGHTRLKLLAILTAQIFRTGPIDFRVGFDYIDLRRSMTIGAVREREPDHVEPPRIHLHRPRCLERDRPRVCGAGAFAVAAVASAISLAIKTEG
jgi:hypothetical protein